MESLIPFLWIPALLWQGARSWYSFSAVALCTWALAARKARGAESGRCGLWWIWGAWILFSCFTSVEPWTSAWAFLQRATVIAFFSLAVTLQDERRRRQWLMCVWIVGAALGIYGLAIRAWRPELGQWLPANPNYTACAVAAVLAAILGVCLHPKSRMENLEKIGLAALALLCASSLILIGSRGAIVGLFATAAGLIFWRGGVRGIAAFGIAAAAALYFIPAGWIGLMAKISDPALAYRTKIWATAVAVARDFPVTGIGPGCYERGYFLHNFPAFNGLSYYGHYATHAHSEPLQLAAESGWLAAILFVFAFCGTMIQSSRRMKSEGSPVRLAAMSAAAAIFIHGLVDGVFALPGLQFLFFSALACAASGKGEEDAPPARFFRPAAAAGLGFCLFMTLAHRSVRGKPWAAPADYSIHIDAARRSLLSGTPNPAQAELSVNRALDLNPTYAAGWGMKAELARMAGDAVHQERFAWNAVGLEPNFLMGHLILAEALAKEKKFDQSREELSRLESLRASLRGIPPGNAYDDLLLLFDERRFEGLKRYLERT